jgi:hypothetical protein
MGDGIRQQVGQKLSNAIPVAAYGFHKVDFGIDHPIRPSGPQLLDHLLQNRTERRL